MNILSRLNFKPNLTSFPKSKKIFSILPQEKRSVCTSVRIKLHYKLIQEIL